MKSKRPLFVDLDGTLITTDLLAESLVSAGKRFAATLLLAPCWLVRGRAYLKSQLADRSLVNAKGLPYRDEVLQLLRSEKQAGARLILATASDRRHAEAVADHLQIFDDVLASNGRANLKGQTKLAAIQNYCCRHGFSEFAYVGDSFSDLPIWSQAAEGYAVEPGFRLRQALARLDQPVRVLGSRRSLLLPLFALLRPRQWTKNLLVGVPLVAAHQLGDIQKVGSSLVAFAAFCCCASAVYVGNDLLDLEADRQHPEKRQRPFASGRLPLVYGPLVALGLLAIAVVLSTVWLNLAFLAVLAVYLGLNGLYSFWLKQKLMIDVVLLALMYSIRIIAGGAATDIVISEWLLGFSIFLFSSLAMVKRYSELARLEVTYGRPMAHGRGYMVGDIRMIEAMGPPAGLIAVLVLALYLTSDQVTILYHRPSLLWLVCPLLLYWTGRIWILAGRREISEDPVTFAIKDWRSWLVALLIGGLMAAASWSW